MTRDEFIGKLRSIYVGEENAIDEIISEYDRLKGALQTLEKLIDEYELGKYDYSVPVFILKDKLKELKEDNK